MNDDYEVGYRKPPKNRQFKKGRSGNPRGRRKGAKNLKTDLLEELQEKILIKEDGAAKSISKQRAALKALMVKALNGDAKALGTLLNLLLKLIPDQEAPQDEGDLSETDRQILAQYEATVLRKHHTKEEKSDET